MKYGFMLIELIVATLIASVIGTLLLTALSQETRFQQVIDMMVDTSLRVGIAGNQLEKDFMGAFIPMQARLKEEQDKDENEPADKNKKTAETKKEDTSKKEAPKAEPKKEKVKKPAEKPLEKIFYGTTKEGHLDTLTFVTNNPLTVFVGKDVGVVKPKVVRVQYLLKPENEKEKNSSFVLIRQESTELDLAKYTNVKSYELIGGIKECTVTYTARIKKEEPKAQQAPAQAGAEKTAGKQQTENVASAQKPKVEYEYKVLKEWVSEQKEEGAKGSNQEEAKKFPRIPYMIEIKMTLWNMQRNKTEDFVFMFELPIDPSVEKKEKEKKEPEKQPEKETKDKDASGDKNTEQQKLAHGKTDEKKMI